MPKHLRAIFRTLSIFLLGTTWISAQCIRQGFNVTPDNDSAITRARAFLELPAIRVGMVQVLHLKMVQGVPLPTSVVCVGFKEASESGAGAEITYRYDWQTISDSGSNEIAFHCDTSGRIDHIEVAPTNNKPFDGFGDFLRDREGDAVEYLIEEMMAPDDPQKRQATEETRKVVAKLTALIVQVTVGVNPQRVTEAGLGLLYDLLRPSAGPPTHGIDGFFFGLGETPAFRNIAIARSELRAAIQKVGAISLRSGGLHDNTDFVAEADEIGRAADTCAQVTAHSAFTVTVGGNRGTESLARLDPALRICTGSAMPAAPVVGGRTARSRRILYSISPVGRGWRDAQGMLVQLWFQPLSSDPTFNSQDLFARYGIMVAHLPQPDVTCSNPPGGGTPHDQGWKQEGTNLTFRFRFDCEYAEIYDGPSHLIVADLALRRSPGNPRKDSYQGVGPLSQCPGGTGGVAIVRWSPVRIDVRVQEPNRVDHLCGGIKVGHVIDGLTHSDTIKISFVPTGH